METTTLPTKFAPAERALQNELNDQIALFSGLDFEKKILDSIPAIILILNKHRQIVFANRVFKDYIKGKDVESIYGLRPGEALNCEHASENIGGCGTTEFCGECHVVKGILISQAGNFNIQECRITQKDMNNVFEFRVWSTPLKYKNQFFTIFSLADISNEKRRRTLERIFFHDIMNTVGGLKGFSHLLLDASPEELDEFKKIINELTDKLIDEIKAQKDLLAAENNELIIHPTTLDSLELLSGIKAIYQNHEIAKGKTIIIDPNSQSIKFKSDKTLISRVIGNMVKNALEAIEPDEIVTIGCKKNNDKIEFWVHNRSYIPRNIQLQIFQRSFSTKGPGRGLGTYSMKLLSKKFLKGDVFFTSSKKTGTVFTAQYPIDF